MAAAYTLVRLQGEWEAGVNLAALVLFALTLIPLIIWTCRLPTIAGMVASSCSSARPGHQSPRWALLHHRPHHHHGGGGGGGGDGDSRTFAIAAGILLLPLDLWLLFALILSTVLWWSNWDFRLVGDVQTHSIRRERNAQRQFN